MSTIENLKDAVISGNDSQVKEYAEQALTEELDVSVIFNSLIAGMNHIGTRFKNNEVYVPEVLMAARAMHAGLNVLKPLITEKNMEKNGTVLIGTVQGDLHDIGKNLVLMMVEGAGYDVVDLGIDVPTDQFIMAVEKYEPKVLCMSALLTTTMPAMAEVIDALSEKGLRDKVKVIIGGAPVNQKYADQIGADGFAPDAGRAVDKVNEVVLGS